MMTKPVVEDVSNRSDEDVEHCLKEFNKTRKVVPDLDLVSSSAVSLRDDLSKDNHSDS
jgi:hypothetical protein